MAAHIHPTAVISPQAELGEDVEIGPFCVVEGKARIGARTRLRSHVVVGPYTEMGEDNVIFPFVAVGMEPQDLKFKGEETRLVIGNRNLVKENATLHRGTGHGGGITTVGDDNLLQVGAHVAHDCHVGNRTILGHNCSLGGHVSVGDGAWVGAYAGVHQFCRVGNHAFLGATTIATMDVLPFVKTVGKREVKIYGINTIGLERKGFSPEAVQGLNKAYRILFMKKLPLAEALEQVIAEYGQIPEVAYFVEFIKGAEQRGFHRN